MGWLLASKTLTLSFGKLRRRCQGKKNLSSGITKDNMGGKTVTIIPHMEQELVNHIQCEEERLYRRQIFMEWQLQTYVNKHLI